MTAKDLESMIDKIVAQIGEHVTSVQILASFPAETGGTSYMMVGCGDWYARQGLAHAFIAMDQARNQADEIADRIGNNDGPEEDWKKA